MINITARGFDLKQGPKDGVEKELKRVEKMLTETASFDVTLTKKLDSYQCDITVKNAGSFIRGEAQAERIEPSIDYAVDDLKRKLRKLKTSLVEKKRKSGIDVLARAMDDLGYIDELEEVNPSTEVRRRKHVLLNMMTDDEAIVQMEMLGHSFFVYLGEDGLTHVIYRRKNCYGVLDCEG
ncbi:MAG: ribosome-associated translation inhibitor RaiA [Massilimaliae sp.]|nr:ribosome-associated translation inhibitor RaiA [Massiliimalia sp.]